MDNENTKNANEKQPGEKPEGKFHYNPGNMSGKTPGDEKTAADAKENSERAAESTEK